MKRPLRLLLVSPAFHGYWGSIERAFVDLGYEVRTHRFDETHKAEKVWNKLRHEVPSRFSGSPRHLSREVVSARTLEAAKAFNPDIALVIRGDSFTEQFWSDLDHVVPSNHLWLYDEVRRMSHSMEFLRTRRLLVTYSRHDQALLRGAGVEAIHVPNAFDPNRSLAPRTSRHEFTFIGARFEAREQALRTLGAHGLPVLAVGRDWSDHPVDRLRTFRVRSRGLPSRRDVPLEQAWALMRDGPATLNIHGDQDGFTMRTFEACGVGAVQLIDREDVVEYFEPGKELLVFTNAEALVDQARRVLAEPARMVRIREAARRRVLAEHTFTHRAKVVETLWA